MKKTIAMMLTLSMLFSATALAVSRDDAQAAATALVGEGAVLKDSDRDDGYFEFEFRDDAANYDVLVDEQSGEVVRLEMEYHAVGKADAATLDEAAARAAVTEAVPGAVIHYALLEQSTKSCEWKVFYTDGEDAVVATLHAQMGDPETIEVFYGAAANLLTADTAVETISTQKGTQEILELDLELDDDTGSLRYEGEARLDGQVYEFELTATSGSANVQAYSWGSGTDTASDGPSIIKWKRD
ncbi:MAG TPA: PepSY domain-containing protein [Candidatus Ventricola gallistercoris]|nr:PepSY domain-containing protein [Candidatus Ventricola gallistercoris]